MSLRRCGKAGHPACVWDLGSEAAVGRDRHSLAGQASLGHAARNGARAEEKANRKFPFSLLQPSPRTRSGWMTALGGRGKVENQDGQGPG